jgi:hypothetical protein
VVIVVAAVAVVALVAAGVAWWLARPGTDLERAVSWAPAASERLTWTDWSGIRNELGVDLDAGSSVAGVQAFLDEGYERDLTSTSALLSSAAVMQQEYGVSPATLDWELLSQSEEGAVVLMGLAEGTDVDALADGFEDLGYQRPTSETGVWKGGPELLARIGGSDLTPELQYLALDADRDLLLASDRAGFLEDTLDEDGDGPASVGDVVEASGEPLSAAIYTGANACSALAMGTADAGDQAQADRLVEEAGEVNPVTGFALAAEPDGSIRVVLSFETEQQARANADSRSVLARGPAPGQGGDFSDRFTVDEVSAEGTVVTLDLDPVEGAYVMSDLSSGPVLFATC